MTASHDSFFSAYRKKQLIVFIALLSFNNVFPQPSKADSLRQLLAKEQIDTNRVRLMWQLARDINSYNPDTALSLSHQALYLAKRLNYVEGISRSLGILSNTFIKISNYPRALELNFEKLQIEEKETSPEAMPAY